MSDTKNKKKIQIHAAATYFCLVSRRADRIAEALNVHPRTITRWSETQDWKDTLNALNYTGDVSFEKAPKRDAERDTGNLFVAARAAYQIAKKNGLPKHKWASSAAELVDLPPRRVRNWAKRHNW